MDEIDAMALLMCEAQGINPHLWAMCKVSDCMTRHEQLMAFGNLAAEQVENCEIWKSFRRQAADMLVFKYMEDKTLSGN